jgi:hypothetical protein
MSKAFDLLGGQSAFFGNLGNRQRFRLPSDFEV